MRYTYIITCKQLTLTEIFEDCQQKFDNNKYQLLSIVPVSFVSHFHARGDLGIRYKGKQKKGMGMSAVLAVNTDDR